MYGESIGMVFVDYDRYVRESERNGMKPVSFFKFALGNF